MPTLSRLSLDAYWGCTTLNCEWGLGSSQIIQLRREWLFCPKCGGELAEITRRPKT